MRKPTRTQTLVIAGLIGAVAIAMVVPDPDAAFIAEMVERYGPASVVALVALGIVVSPIPSGAIAMVAGALYGVWFGGGLTIAGAVLGAGGAFLLSRRIGRERLVVSRSALAIFLTRDRSQAALMAIVFVTRLIPFISFDAVSYVAGLTPLRFWRFIVATAAGTTPVCLAFAAAGNAATQGAMHPALLAALAGMTLLVPGLILAGRAFWRRPAIVA